MKEDHAHAAEAGRNLEWIFGHRLRQRERSLNTSWDEFRNHEMLEVLLGYVVPRQDMSRQARELAARYQTVLDVLLAPPEELLTVQGMTPGMVSWLKLAGELVTLYQKAELRPRQTLRRFVDVQAFLEPRMRRVKPPDAWALYTNFEDILISCQRLPMGRFWWRPENVRAMVEDCVALEARNVIIAVFRASGSVRMSAEERAHLRTINDTFNTLQVALLDCVLVNERGAHSMSFHERFDFIRPKNHRADPFDAVPRSAGLGEGPDRDAE